MMINYTKLLKINYPALPSNVYNEIALPKRQETPRKIKGINRFLNGTAALITIPVCFLSACMLTVMLWTVLAILYIIPGLTALAAIALVYCSIPYFAESVSAALMLIGAAIATLGLSVFLAALILSAQRKLSSLLSFFAGLSNKLFKRAFRKYGGERN